MRHQSVELVLAEETTHSTDQPGGKAITPANISSKVLPENNATSKAEYTNQQGLPDYWIYLVHLSRHARFFGLRGLFC